MTMERYETPAKNVKVKLRILVITLVYITYVLSLVPDLPLGRHPMKSD
jgi:hypothetical protein